MTQAKHDEKPEHGATAQLAIHKGADGELELGGLRFVACRREIEGIDGGVTLIARAAVDGEERDLVRFDFFRKRPHYHVPAENASERSIDGERLGDGLDWGIAEIAARMPALVEEAGFAEVAAGLDAEELAARAGEIRTLVGGLAEPSETTHVDVDPKVVAALGG